MNYMVRVTIGTDDMKETVSDDLDTKTGPNLVKVNCPPRARAGNAVTLNATRLQSAADTQLELKDVVKLNVQW